jgi:NADPH-dependent glutamate synthase beta subunit-like oxidoreductase
LKIISQNHQNKLGLLIYYVYICTMAEEEDLRLVKVQLATCSKCGGAVKVAVSKYIDRATTREFAKLMEDGCEIHTTNVIVARTVRWCDAPCEGMWPKSKN